MIWLSHYFCWPSIFLMGKSIFEIFMWLLCLLLRQSPQELPRASTEPNGARLYKAEGWVIFLYRVCVDFQLAFTKPIQRREHGKTSSVLKVHGTTLVREKTCQNCAKAFTLWKDRSDKCYLSLLCEKQFQRHFYPQPSWKNLTTQCR